MAQLSISFGIGFESLPVINQGLAKVTHRSSITANESDVDWGDTYEEYEDFSYTTQTWH